MALRRGHVDGPVAGAVDVRRAALLECLIGAGLRTVLVVRLALGGFDGLLEHVVEALVAEVALLVGDPFLQPEVRLDDELLLRHGDLHFVRRSRISCSARPVRRSELPARILFVAEEGKPDVSWDAMGVTEWTLFDPGIKLTLAHEGK